MLLMKNSRVEELKRKVEELEDTIFLIEMIDHWTREDEESFDKYSKELREIKNLLTEEIVNN